MHERHLQSREPCSSGPASPPMESMDGGGILLVRGHIGPYAWCCQGPRPLEPVPLCGDGTFATRNDGLPLSSQVALVSLDGSTSVTTGEVGQGFFHKVKGGWLALASSQYLHCIQCAQGLEPGYT